MDRSVDGGMAPALQSCNYQSANLVSLAEKVNEVVLREKINGSISKDSVNEGKNADASNFLSEVNEAEEFELSGKPDLTESSDSIKETFKFYGLKNAMPPVLMPAIHIGQGGSSAAILTSCNGWLDCKSQQSAGVLQESSNITNVDSATAMNKKVTIAEKPDVIENAKFGNQHVNSAILDFQQNFAARSNSPVLRSKIQKFGSTSNKGPDKSLENSVEVSEKTSEWNLVRSKMQSEEDSRQLEVPNGDNRVSPAFRSLLRLRRESLRSPVLERPKSPVLESTERAQSPVLKSSECTNYLADGGACSSVLSSSQGSTLKVSRTGECLVSQATQHSESPVWEFSKCTKSACNEDTELSHALYMAPTVLKQSRHSLAQLDIGQTVQSPLVEQSLKSTLNDKIDFLAPISPVLQRSQSSSIKARNVSSNPFSGLATGLVNINMSDKLANTLQELAALLKGSPMSLEMEASSSDPVAVECADTVNIEGEESVVRSAVIENLSAADLACKKLALIKEQEMRIEAKSKAATDAAEKLDGCLRLLKSKTDVLRCCAVKARVKKELSDIAFRIPSASNFIQSDRRRGNATVLNFTKNVSPSSEFWCGVFQNATGPRTAHTPACDGDSARRKLKDILRTMKNMKSSSPNVRQPCVNRTGVDSDMCPYVQLTRLENVHATPSAHHQKFFQLAEVNTGILRKELHYVMSQCDPDLTDSSADEEVTEPVRDTRSHRIKNAVKTILKPSVARFQKSFCKWVAERAEMSRRWVWLHSQISSLEIDICNQRELHARFRSNKGEVQFNATDRWECCTTNVGSTTYQQRTPTNSGAPPTMCNASVLINDIDHHASSKDRLCHAATSVLMVPSVNKTGTCARTRQLRLSTFCNRTLVKLSPAILASRKTDSFIMSADSFCQKNGGKDDTLLILKAAAYDCSYHSVISSVKDIPLSISTGAVMKSNCEWCIKSTSSKRGRFSQKYQNKTKHKMPKSTKRHVGSSREGRKRKPTKQLSSRGRKRNRRTFIPDAELPVVVSDFNSFQPSRTGAAISMKEGVNHGQANWKKKKTNDQAFDIDNIVIPHGLNMTRIEKLVYKEIQTPGWKISEMSPTKEPDDKQSDLKVEDISAQTFQGRHCNYEIKEKRKHSVVMEWRASRKKNGRSLMGSKRRSTVSDSVATSSPSDTPSSILFTEDSHAVSSGCVLPPDTSNCVVANPGSAWRKKFCSFEQPAALQTHVPPQQSDNSLVTSLDHSYSFPPLWHDRLGSGLSCDANAAPVSRSLSDTFKRRRIDCVRDDTWEIRTFPLAKEDVRLLSDVDHEKIKLFGCGSDAASDSHWHGQNCEGATGQIFHLQGSADTSSHGGMFYEKSQQRFESVVAPLERTDHKVSSEKTEAERILKHKLDHDTSSDLMDGDTNSSGNEASSSIDAGFIVDDNADPEWEAPAQRRRDQR